MKCPIPECKGELLEREVTATTSAMGSMIETHRECTVCGVVLHFHSFTDTKLPSFIDAKKKTPSIGEK